MQQPGGTDAASAATISLLYVTHSASRGACQRLVGSLQLQLSTLALLLAAAWAAVQAAAARLVAALHLQGSLLARRSRSPQVGAGATPVPALGPSDKSGGSSLRQRLPAAVAPAAVPRHVSEAAQRLTICIDLDETLLVTFRVTHRRPRGRATSDDGGCQLVPSHWQHPAATAQQQHEAPAATGSYSLTASLAALFRSRSAGGCGGSSDGAGSYSLTRRCSDDLGAVAAAGASAWMHYTPPPAGAAGSGGAARVAPHTLAVFERPGCREFLAAASRLGDLVLFSAAAPPYAAPLAELLDPGGRLFAARLYGDACVSRHGRRHVKDLSVLGRDVSRCVLVDNCLWSFLAQPECGLPVLPFHGQAADGQLLGVVLPLLASLAQVTGDVRPLLGSMFRVREWLASKGYDV